MPFYNDITSRHNIVISSTAAPRYNFGAFAKGYHLAANRLSQEFLSKNGFRDYEGYPIVFLYRHALELNLKNVIYWAVRLCPFKNIASIDSKLYNRHELTELAQLSRDLLLKLFPADPDIKKVTKRIITTAKEFDEIDPTSFSYRYPIDRKGSYSTKKHQIVNILSIHKNMDCLLSDLETVNFGLDIETDKAQELYQVLNDYFLIDEISS
jgi:hypothetical protein